MDCGPFLKKLPKTKLFAYDIILISTYKSELSNMLNELNEDNTIIENVDHYICLGHKIKLRKENQIAEIKRRIHLEWVAFGTLNCIYKERKVPIHLRQEHMTAVYY